jgi:phosphatidylserine/phosphatidylglycerophosphate/cardiolipin synthase-like enzyme
MTKEYESYSGNSSYRYVDKLIKNSDRELLIVSPYISDYYTKMLIKEAPKKKIRIITSESSLSYKDSSLGKYVIKGIWSYVKAIGFFLFLDLVSAYLQFYYITAILTAMVLVLAIFAYRKHKKTISNIKAKIAKKRFVHEKLYIGEDLAIVGSANLTYNGMHRNLEHIDVINDSDRIKDLKSHFEVLWANN